MDLQLMRILSQKTKLVNSDAAFMGALALGMPTVRKDSVGTFATDGVHIFYNDEFCASLKGENIRAILCHEMWHMLLDHVGRGVDFKYNRRRGNIAMDYIVNDIVVSNPCYGVLPKTIIVNGQERKLYVNPKYNSTMTLEEVYHAIGPGEDCLEEGHILDDHAEFEGSAIDKDHISDAINRAANTCGSEKVPEQLREYLEKASSNGYNWKSLLRSSLSLPIFSDKTYSRASRRSFPGAAYIKQGVLKNETVNIYIGIDTSGSISNDDIASVFGELRNLVKCIPLLNIVVWSFDTSIHNVKSYTSFNTKELFNYQPMGGGGTAFEANYDLIKTMKKPDAFLMFTDGCPGGTWGDPDLCPTIFVIKNHMRPKPPFGKVIYLNA